MPTTAAPLALGDSTIVRVGDPPLGIGFAVPVNTAKDFLAMVRRDGPVKPS